MAARKKDTNVCQMIPKKEKWFAAFLFFLFSMAALFSFTGLKEVLPTKISCAISNSLQSLFTVQATIITLSITILTMLGNSTNTSIYGIHINKFIMHIHPVIFKYDRLVIGSLILTIFSYICYILKLNYFAIAAFIVTLSIIILIWNDMYVYMRDPKTIENDIKTFVFSKLMEVNGESKNYYAERLLAEIMNKIEQLDSISFKTNFNILYDAIIKHIEELRKIPEMFSIMYAEIISKLSNAPEGWMQAYIIQKLIDLFQKANHAKMPIIITDKAGKSLYLSIKKAKEEFAANDFLKIELLHQAMYHNLVVNQEGFSQNCWDIQSFSIKIYSRFFGEGDIIPKIYFKLKVSLFESICKTIEHKKLDERNRRIAQIELLEYTRILFWARDEEALNRTWLLYIEQAGYYMRKPGHDYKNYIFYTLGYMHYIVCYEKSVEESQRDFFNLIVRKNADILRRLISRLASLPEYCDIWINEHDRKYLNWEYWPLYPTAKFCMFPQAMQDMYLFSILVNNPISVFNRLTSEVCCSIYGKYFMQSSTLPETNKRYASFCKFFGIDSRNIEEQRWKFYGENLLKQCKEKELIWLKQKNSFLFKSLRDELRSHVKGWIRPFSYTGGRQWRRITISLQGEILDSILNGVNYREEIVDMLQSLIWEKIYEHMQSYIEWTELNLNVDFGHGILSVVNAVTNNEGSLQIFDSIVGNPNVYWTIPNLLIQEFCSEKKQLYEKFGKAFLIIDTKRVYLHLGGIRLFVGKRARKKILKRNSDFKNEDGTYSYSTIHGLQLDLSPKELICYERLREKRSQIIINLFSL